jgi:CO dehydrogenase/acetyl-CoA synthase gamma subunit (corrinoid Fe-S protein)
MMEVLRLLPRTNCRECGEPTCMVFAVRVIEGAKDQDNCPSLQGEKREELKQYLSQFHFE